MPSRPKKDKYKATAWQTEVTTDLEVPSGQLCLVRRPGVTGLIKAGLLDSLDSLTGLVQSEHISPAERARQGLPAVSQQEIKDFAASKEKLASATTLMDKVVEHVVIEPNVLRPVRRDPQGRPITKTIAHPPDLSHTHTWTEEIEEDLPDDERVSGQVYTDMVDLIDKIYIFQFVVGGVTDLERFRQEFGESMAGLESLANVSGAAE